MDFPTSSILPDGYRSKGLVYSGGFSQEVCIGTRSATGPSESNVTEELTQLMQANPGLDSTRLHLCWGLSIPDQDIYLRTYLYLAQ